MTANLIIIGAGQMGSAIAKGLAKNGSEETAKSIYLYDLDKAKLKQLQADFCFGILDEIKNLETIVSNDTIVLFAVKPQNIDELLEEMGSLKLPANLLLISILAGTKISKFSKYFPQNPIIRVMPNTPAQISKSATVFSTSSNCNDEHRKHCKRIFEVLGITLELPEDKLDLVTALSGSGPAYLFLLTEAMTEAAIKLGLDTETAKVLSRQTVYGAANLMIESKEEASNLREKVTSPNGTTHAALESFKANNFKDIVFKAIEAACKRSKELS